MEEIMFKPFLAAAALSAAIAAGPATAEETQGNSKTVTYSDLDLSTKQGQKELEVRFARAAREVCEADAKRTGTRMMSTEVRRCLAEAKKSTKAAMARILSDNQLGG
ncbi:UrcA family protein [Altererythrobacter sp. BO-6]|uniref:UrcA family protein n=1 Tax=Altererythrobacter sp. BO-6 TaxID=2604537 RepID=UPI0013E1FAE1|nr:UrcA family protein [Altererythrobacter sp. BO-6]QIG54192.1 UrcA family protein [Altererythrobacter sp. BO-6]